MKRRKKVNVLKLIVKVLRKKLNQTRRSKIMKKIIGSKSEEHDLEEIKSLSLDEMSMIGLKLKSIFSDIFFTESSLSLLVELQKTLQEALANRDILDKTEDVEELFKKVLYQLQCVQAEIQEFIQSFPWKSWKDYGDKKEYFMKNYKKIVEEYVDIYFFLFNIALLLKISGSEIENIYITKNMINLSRITTGNFQGSLNKRTEYLLENFRKILEEVKDFSSSLKKEETSDD